MAPIGRVTKPAPNVASDNIRLANCAVRGKKRVADLDREKAVGDEIIELEHIADGRGQRATTDKRLMLRLGCQRLAKRIVPSAPLVRWFACSGLVLCQACRLVLSLLGSIVFPDRPAQRKPS